MYVNENCRKSEKYKCLSPIIMNVANVIETNENLQSIIKVFFDTKEWHLATNQYVKPKEYKLLFNLVSFPINCPLDQMVLNFLQEQSYTSLYYMYKTIIGDDCNRSELNFLVKILEKSKILLNSNFNRESIQIDENIDFFSQEILALFTSFYITLYDIFFTSENLHKFRTIVQHRIDVFFERAIDRSIEQQRKRLKH